MVTFLTPLVGIPPEPKGSIGLAFAVSIHTENQNQAGFSPFGPRDVSVATEPPFGHLRYSLTDVPPQPNSPPDAVHDMRRPGEGT